MAPQSLDGTDISRSERIAASQGLEQVRRQVREQEREYERRRRQEKEKAQRMERGNQERRPGCTDTE